MSGHWSGSSATDRKVTLPINWVRLRRHVLKRDGHVCRQVEHGVRCCQPANQVDHIGDRHDHDPANLQALCSRHHALKTSQQGLEALRARPKQERARERHPGYVR